MRKVLQKIEVVGAVLVYQEGDIIRWSLDYLYNFCDRVLIILDNYNEYTKNIVFEYRDKYPEKTVIGYSKEPVQDGMNKVTGRTKKRFKLRQSHIREWVIRELKKMHDTKPIDLLIWPDSDEIFVDSFPKLLEDFWHNQKEYDYMMLGFIEVYDSFRIILNQRMAPHGRVWRYRPDMSAQPYRARTRYNPYKRGYKLRNVVVHLCHLTEKQRVFRRFSTHRDEREENRVVWFLPEDVRTIDQTVLATDYRTGHRGAPAKIAPVPLTEYLNNKDKYKEYLT